MGDLGKTLIIVGGTALIVFMAAVLIWLKIKRRQ